MSDDLVKRLRQHYAADYVVHGVCDEAADRIEKLETNFQLQLEWYLSNKRVLDDRIKKLEAALRRIKDLHDQPGPEDEQVIMIRDDMTYKIVCDTLEEEDD